MAIANDADLRIRAPKRRSDPNTFLEVTAKVPKPLDNRLPAPGTWIEREYRGQRIAVKVRADGFEFEGRVYKSLTAVANRCIIKFMVTTPE